jgi:peptide/nickel transport system permease protein
MLHRSVSVMQRSPSRHGQPGGREGSSATLARVLASRVPVVASWIFLGLVVIASILAPMLTPLDPLAQDLEDRLLPPAWSPAGKMPHVLGTDQLGRDILSRILYGGRVTLLIATSSVTISGIVGMTLGIVSGYFGGRLDNLIMRLADAQLAMPFILLAIAIIGILGPSLPNLIAVLSLTGWVVYARISRSLVLTLRQRDFVEAARALGARHSRVLLVHILPNLLPMVSVVASLELATMIFGEAALSFLGLGVPPPTPTWGSMLGDGRSYLFVAWWLSTFPGLALALTVLCINVAGDWIRDRLDVRLRSSD